MRLFPRKIFLSVDRDRNAPQHPRVPRARSRRLRVAPPRPTPRHASLAAFEKRRALAPPGAAPSDHRGASIGSLFLGPDENTLYPLSYPRRRPSPALPPPPLALAEKFVKKTDDAIIKADDFDEVEKYKAAASAASAESGGENACEGLTDAEIRDKIKQERWTEPSADVRTPEYRARWVQSVSFGAVKAEDTGVARDFLYFLSGVNWTNVALFWWVMYCIWVFLLVLGIMGTGFKLLGGKDSSKMFDIADNPISAMMIGVLATVLVQSSSTTTSIIIALVGANEPASASRCSW